MSRSRTCNFDPASTAYHFNSTGERAPAPSFFFDTADPDFIAATWKKISRVFPAGAVRGVTTNPNALSKVKVNSIEGLKEHLEKLCRLVSGIRPDGQGIVYVQQPNSRMDAASLCEWADLLTAMGDGKTRLGLKIAPFPSALEAGRDLQDAIEINVTGVSDCATALRAFSYGVRYVSIIAGRMEEIGADAKAHVHFVQQRNSGTGEIITGSMRTVEGLRWVCQAGTVPTIGSRVWEKLFTEIAFEELPSFWNQEEPAQELQFAPVTTQGQIDLSRQFFEQMDGLGEAIYREFTTVKV
ncbi:MAG: hypothetical protein HY717_21600 [Planctomycetes bacterium]|nr:hypothetical protein [Planctomycetota bacterium]